jgi:16S rRNA (cytidine1402-2'-O)-methyltransferase
MGVLYLVATPIGNLEDITLRALRILRNVSLIAAEDTRTARKLLSHHNIPAPKLLSYTDRNKNQRTPAILEALQHSTVALVSEAGMPGISDPGADLVQATLAEGHDVVVLPGASALPSALAVSGLSTRRALYLGFLPRTQGARRKLLRDASGQDATIVAFEAPHRLRAALDDALTCLGDRPIAVCRELTKLHEEVFRGTISQARAYFGTPRGEFTLVIDGIGQAPPIVPDAEMENLLRQAQTRGLRARDAVRDVASITGASRQTVYRRWVALKTAGALRVPSQGP